jgi:molecular chaperone IbpA
MATLDFAPLFRSSVGFDRLPGLLSDALERDESAYPPYNIEKCGEDQYRIVLALAGFTRDDMEIVVAQNRLFVRGRMKDRAGSTYLHRGIASRPFERQFDLADFIEVTGATMGDGLLVIDLKRELPEALKPRSIPINAGTFMRLGSRPPVGTSAAVEQQPGDRIAA